MNLNVRRGSAVLRAGVLLSLCVAGCQVPATQSEVVTAAPPPGAAHANAGNAPPTPAAAGGGESEAGRNNRPQFTSPSFVGRDVAWVLTAAGELLGTSDGGASWHRAAVPAGGLSAVGFIDERRGWALDAAHQGIVSRTEDGGRTWAVAARLKGGGGRSEFLDPREVVFFDESHGWIIETSNIWRTEDGGATWAKGIFAHGARPRGSPLSASFVSAAAGWVCGSEGEVFGTEDGGKTWRARTVVKGAAIDDISFVNARAGWLVNAYAEGQKSGRVYRTADGGRTWTLLPALGEGVYLESIFFRDEAEGWGVGRVYLPGSVGVPPLDIAGGLVRGVVLHTKDGGQSWREAQAGGREPFFSGIHFADARHGWLLGRDAIYRTEDGGATWRPVLQLPPLVSSPR